MKQLGENSRFLWRSCVGKAWADGMACTAAARTAEHRSCVFKQVWFPWCCSRARHNLVVCASLSSVLAGSQGVQAGSLSSFLSRLLGPVECLLLRCEGNVLCCLVPLLLLFLIINAEGWRRDCRYTRSVLLLGALMYLPFSQQTQISTLLLLFLPLYRYR